MSTYNISGLLQSTEVRKLQQQFAIAAQSALLEWDRASEATVLLLQVRPTCELRTLFSVHARVQEVNGMQKRA